MKVKYNNKIYNVIRFFETTKSVTVPFPGGWIVDNQHVLEGVDKDYLGQRAWNLVLGEYEIIEKKFKRKKLTI